MNRGLKGRFKRVMIKRPGELNKSLVDYFMLAETRRKKGR